MRVELVPIRAQKRGAPAPLIINHPNAITNELRPSMALNV